ncbi:hypothetical protein [uncultured Enterococcus sp.]|uniref:hypothetical protein n=1 Tax=uncultured Enterococcus sp. TaxID=167972 RepID=UPI002AA625E5|nr:hypothetical protein [uncultured Enterococcus sp.]
MKARDLINDLVKADAFGHYFIAFNMTEIREKDSGELTGYRMETNVQDEKSPYRFQTLSVKIKSTNPSITQINNTLPVDFTNLTCTFINDYGDTFWAADDVNSLVNKK